jgi:outer membrane lipoprotein-sorting protein
MLALLSWALPVVAQPVPVAMPVAEAARWVEGYVNGLTTLEADFTQRVSDEAFLSEGTFALKRPRQFVWQYDTPNRQMLIGTGTAAYFVDQEGPNTLGGSVGQVTQLPLNAGLGRLFGVQKLNLAKAGLVVVQAQRKDGALQVRMRLAKGQTDATGLQHVTLRFAPMVAKKTFQLQQIDAFDALNVTTTLVLSNVRTGQVIASKRFAFTPPVGGEH